MSEAHVAPARARPSQAASFLGGYFWLLIILLYLPIGILVLFSLNANQVLAFPLQGFTLYWYARALGTPEAISAARNSLLVAVSSSVITTALATMVSILIARYDFRGKSILLAISTLPLIVKSCPGFLVNRVLDVVSAFDLLTRGALPGRAVGLSFDDGFRDVAGAALPALLLPRPSRLIEPGSHGV